MIPLTKYIEYKKGTLPILLISAHGGYMIPDEIPDRKNGNLCPDLKTIEFSLDLYNQANEIWGGVPHLLICNLSRSKIDLNRSKYIGTECKETREIWDKWFNYIEEIIGNIKRDYGYGIIFDIHGHGDLANKIWLGYGLNKIKLDTNQFNENSIQNLIKLGNHNSKDILIEKRSLGYIINKLYNKDMCLPNFENKIGSQRYLSGGLIIKKYGCNGLFDAIQIEIPNSLRTDPKKRIEFIKIFLESILLFLSQNLHINIFHPT